jgi:hypothetical protein
LGLIGYSISTQVIITAANIGAVQYEIEVQAYATGSGNDRITAGTIVIYTLI